MCHHAPFAHGVATQCLLVHDCACYQPFFNNHILRLGGMQATKTVRRDICPVLLPATLYHLLSLKRPLITVEDVLGRFMPFTPLNAKALVHVTGNARLPNDLAAVCPPHAVGPTVLNILCLDVALTASPIHSLV